jgi:hypothetical protein
MLQAFPDADLNPNRYCVSPALGCSKLPARERVYHARAQGKCNAKDQVVHYRER